MAGSTYSAWVEQYVLTQKRLYFGSAVALFFVALFALLVTFGVNYVVLYIIFSWLTHITSTQLTVLTAVSVALLFPANAYTNRAYLSEMSFSTGTMSDEIVSIPGVGSNVNYLAPDSAHSVVKLLCSTLLQGPRLIDNSWNTYRRSVALGQMNLTHCAEVLRCLAASPHRVDVSDLVAQLPQINLSRELLGQVREIPGVVVLQKPAPGFTLTDSLRGELKGLA